MSILNLSHCTSDDFPFSFLQHFLNSSSFCYYYIYASMISCCSRTFENKTVYPAASPHVCFELHSNAIFTCVHMYVWYAIHIQQYVQHVMLGHVCLCTAYVYVCVCRLCVRSVISLIPTGECSLRPPWNWSILNHKRSNGSLVNVFVYVDKVLQKSTLVIREVSRW